MPSSRPNTIPTVIHLLRQLKPQSILDVGVGFGKWGHLFREYTDILEAEHEPARYQRRHWRVRIDGIEGHAAYLTPMHRFLYNRIHVGDAARLIRKLPRYDLIFLGDIIEHFDKPAGLALLGDALAKARQAVIVSTPKFETEQEDLCGNELERHRSLWTARDFRKFPGATVKTVDGATLLAVLRKEGVPELRARPPRPPKAGDAQRLSETRKQLAELVPRGESFVLVDEEHLRGTLRHTRSLPFLEKAGQYWGPPPDDATAIHELERLRQAGARSIVFIWTTFWWLKHYEQFERHLRSRYDCTHETDCVVAFDLGTLKRKRRG
jgi:hypothetical protein